MKNAELNIIIQKDDESGWYVGQIEEFPAAISQAKTIDELKENLIDAKNMLKKSILFEDDIISPLDVDWEANI